MQINDVKMVLVITDKNFIGMIFVISKTIKNVCKQQHFQYFILSDCYTIS